MLEHIADALQTRPDLAAEGSSRDELRAEALGRLTHLEDAIALLKGTYSAPVVDTAEPDAEEPEPEPEPGSTTEPAPQPPVRQRAVLHVHLSQAAVEAALRGCADGTAGIARVEELGPMLLTWLRRLLGHAHIDVKPVIDLNENRSVNGYNTHPTFRSGLPTRHRRRLPPRPVPVPTLRRNPGHTSDADAIGPYED